MMKAKFLCTVLGSTQLSTNMEGIMAMKTRTLLLALALVLALSACGGAGASSSAAPAASQAAPAGSSPASASSEDAASGYPERDISLVIQSSPGGGSDLFARTFANAVTANELLPVTIVPENMPGGNGAMAYAYVAEKAGDPYFLLNASGSFITMPVLGQGTDAANVNYEDFICIAAVALDEMAIAVNAESQFQTLQELVDYAAANPDMLNAGGTGTGGPDGICYHLLEKATGAAFNDIAFEGGDEVNAALLGNNVDVAIGNPGDFLELAKAGRFRVLGTFSDERLACMPDVPTVKEQGIDAVYSLTRGFVAPSGIPEDVVAALEKCIQDYMQTEDWKAYVEANSITERYMDSAEFTAFCAESTESHMIYLKEMGLIS
jgi:putative tricarboxylic transport membrane protein